MKPVVVRNIPRADANACGVLEGLGMVGVGHEGEYDRWLLQR
jgi:hypothetical protein